MSEVKDKLITAENLKNAYDDNKRAISALKGDLVKKIDKPTTTDNNKFPRAKNGDVEWVEQGLPTDTQTASAVTNWLNEHPEATTTVQDGSINSSKFSDDVLSRFNSFSFLSDNDTLYEGKILFLTNKGWISRMLNRNIFVNLAQYTYSIYLSHGLVILILWSTLWKTHNHLVHQYPVLNFVLTLVLILIIGVILHYSVENPATKYLKEKIK